MSETQAGQQQKHLQGLNARTRQGTFSEGHAQDCARHVIKFSPKIPTPLDDFIKIFTRSFHDKDLYKIMQAAQDHARKS